MGFGGLIFMAFYEYRKGVKITIQFFLYIKKKASLVNVL
jgi:hypothetical protein